MSQTIRPEQTLTTTFTVTTVRQGRGFSAPHRATADIVVNGTSVACSGEGPDVESAPLDVLLRIIANQILCAGESIAEGEQDVATVPDKTLASAISLLRREQRRRAKSQVSMVVR